MGQRAREIALRRTTRTQRFDAGLQLADRSMAAALARAGIPHELPPKERARRGFEVLRRLGR